MLLVALSLPIVYHTTLYMKCRIDGCNSLLGYGNRMRKSWAKFVLSREDQAILGIQAIRNEIMWGSFLGMTSFTALTIIISTWVSNQEMGECSLQKMTRFDPLTGSYRSIFSPTIKVLLMVSLLAAIFAMTLQYLRILKHLSVYVGCSGTLIQEDVTKAVGKMYNMSSFWHFMAMRFLLSLFASIGWLFGPTYCLASSVLVLMYMTSIDRISSERMPRKPKKKKNQDTPLSNLEISAETGCDGLDQRV